MPPGRLVAVIAGAIARRLDRVLDGDDEDAVSTPWPGRPATTGAATSADGGGAGHPAREPRPDSRRARTAEGPGQQQGPDSRRARSRRPGPSHLEQAARIARTSSFWKKAVLLLNYACEASPTVATVGPRRPNGALGRAAGPRARVRADALEVSRGSRAVAQAAGEGRRPRPQILDTSLDEGERVEAALHAVRRASDVRRAAEVGVHEGAEAVALAAGCPGPPGHEEGHLARREGVLAPGAHRARLARALGGPEEEADGFVVDRDDGVGPLRVAAVNPAEVVERLPARAEVEVGGEGCLLGLTPGGVDEGGANLVVRQWFHGLFLSVGQDRGARSAGVGEVERDRDR